jgi:hypothetical protein
MNLTKQDAVAAFSKGEIEARIAAKHVRFKMDFDEQQFVLKHLSVSDRFVEQFLIGKCFASAWKDIWIPPRTRSTSSPAKSVNWLLLTLQMFPEKLNAHIKIRDSLNCAVLRGEWDICGQLLQQHKKELGPTLWSLNWTILLIEEYSGTQKKIEYVSNFGKEEFGPVVKFFADNFCFSSDQTLRNEVFREIITNAADRNKTFSHFIELIFLEDCASTWNLAKILEFFEFVPLVDRYEFFLRLVVIALSEHHRDIPRLLKALRQLQPICPDASSQFMLDTGSDDEPITNVNGSSKYIKAWDAYSKSDYENSLSLAYGLIEEYPYLLPAHEIVVKSQLYLKKRNSLTGSAPIYTLSHNLKNIFAKNEKSDDSLQYLQLFARRYRIFSLTHPLRALCASHSSNLPDEMQFRKGSYCCLVHGPRNFEYGHTVEDNRLYLGRCAATFKDSLSISFFCHLANGQTDTDGPLFAQIPKVRRVFFAGLAAARQNRHDQALAYLKGFLRLQKDDSENPLSPFAIEEARKNLVEIYRLKGDVVSMQTEVINTFLERSQAVRRLPVGRIFESAQEQRSIASQHIEYPIIAYLACHNPHDIYIALKHFFYKNHINKPSDLINLAGISERKLALLLLRVCTTEVIDSLDALDSVAKVENERLNILRWVSKHGGNFSVPAEAEILRLVQHIQLRDALEKIEGARVVVNVAALRETERERFRDIYLRFSALKDVAASKATEQLSELLNTISTVALSAVKIVFIDSEALRRKRESTITAFAAAFLEIRNAFVYSAHFGVEASLSGRIRHGIVVQHIRKPFVEKHLAVLKDSTEKGDIEQYWERRLVGCSKSQVHQAMDLLFALTAKINSIAEEVKAEWLHSRTEHKHPNGLFNYAFFTAELEEILDKKMRDVNDVESFLDRVFDVLLERTRTSLAATKARVDNDLRQRLGVAVDDAISNLSAFDYTDSLSYRISPFLALRNDLSSCRQDVERLCDQMTAWFQEADATLMGDAGLDLVVHTAVGMVEQLNPEVRGKFNTIGTCQQRVKGRHFTSLVHIVFFMLDNARCHSDVNKTDFRATVSLLVSDSRLTIAVTSNMSSLDAADRSKSILEAKVSQLDKALDPETVTKEGGSGYAKIFAAVRYGFKQTYPNVTATYEQNHNITVSVSFALDGLIV